MDSVGGSAISIIGGGINGITTAIVLRLAGYNPTVFTNFDFERYNVNESSEFKHLYSSKHQFSYELSEIGSLHGAAAIIPHTVAVKPPLSENQLASISKRFFKLLSMESKYGVRNQKHYELFEEPPLDSIGSLFKPSYSEVVDNFQFLPEDGSGAPNIPRRSLNGSVFGWMFDMFFVEAPVYIKSLYECFRSISGPHCIKVLSEGSFLEMREIMEMKDEYDGFVLCLGANARKMFREEADKSQIYRGHYIKIPRASMLEKRSKNARVVAEKKFSYNYTPTAENYPANIEKTIAADCYFYPRSDGWILGGSRQLGDVVNGEWIGAQTFSDELDLQFRSKRVRVPKPILDINAEILRYSTGIDVRGMDMFADIGFRFVRSDGVRLELEEIQNRPIVYNYGHGGSGYTFSWGAAIEVAKLLKLHRKEHDELPQNLHQRSSDTVISMLSKITQELLA